MKYNTIKMNNSKWRNIYHNMRTTINKKFFFFFKSIIIISGRCLIDYTNEILIKPLGYDAFK